jgi:predicted RNA binding protein YcfA (HicA-like mRNA interferase family)
LPNLPRLTPQEAENLLFKAGFKLIRSKGSHCIYLKGNRRQITISRREYITSQNSETDLQNYRIIITNSNKRYIKTFAEIGDPVPVEHAFNATTISGR